jgi:hypothetical protein
MHLKGDASPARKEGKPLQRHWPDAKSTLILANSLVVVTQYSGAVDGAVDAIRPLLGADVTASYQDGSANVCGILGSKVHGAYTDAYGVALNPIDKTSTIKSAMANAGSVLASMDLMNPTRSWTYSSTLYTYSQGRVIIATDEQEYWMKMYSTNTADELTVGDQVGFDVAAGTGATSRIIHHAVTVNPSASVKCAVVRGFCDTDNTVVRIAILPAFQQWRTNFPYTAQ